uniref:hypothetical protein n=1 Tax=Streptococcus agalactiae TaxID=1311 RepID=UPI00178C2B41
YGKAEALQEVKSRLYRDNDPLIDVEPPVVWAWESDFDMAEKQTAGKLMNIELNASADSVVPGDWIYFINPEEISNKKIGYEG